MASPFAVFRKHQAVLLAVFGVMIIILFAIGDPLMQWASHRDEGERDPVVVTWSGGQLTRSRLASMIGSRGAAVSFLTELQRRGQTGEGLLISEQSLNSTATVRIMLLAARVQELGFSVSNEEIGQYLDRLGGKTVDRDEMRKIVEERKHTLSGIFDPLRKELLARKMLEFVGNGLRAMPPADQFQVYLRLHRRADVDLVALPVDTFLDKAAAPSDEELAQYFAKYKETLPPLDVAGADVLDSPEPGFKLPYRADINYFSANFDDFVDRARARVTDDEIAKYYEQHKETDRDLWRQDFLTPPIGSPDKKDDPAKKDGEAKKDENRKDEAKNDTAKEKQPGQGAEGKSPEAKDAGSEKSKDPPVKAESKGAATPGEKPAGDPQPADKGAKAASDTKDNETKDKSSPASEPPSRTPSPTQEIGEQDNNGAAAQLAQVEKTPKDAADAGKSPPEKTAADKEAKPDAAQAPDAPAKSDATSKDAEIKTPAAGDKPPVAEKPGVAAPAGSSADSRYRPLSEVKDQIRKRVAEEKAAQDLFKAFEAIEKRLLSYRTSLREARGEPADKQPKLPDYDAIAKEYDLQYHKTGLVSRRAFMAKGPFGRSFTLDNDPRQGPVMLHSSLYSQAGEHSLFQPEPAGAFEGAAAGRYPDYWYLAWKGADKLEAVPELADVQDDVLKHYKRGVGRNDAEATARALALAAAKALAEKARAGTPLAELVKSQPGAKLVEPDQFTWLTAESAGSDDNPIPAKLTEVEGVDDPGPAFMEAVFRLAAGEVAVAMNHPRTVVYVIKANSQPKSITQLREDFLVNMSTYEVYRNVMAVTRLQEEQLVRRVIEDVESHFHLTWIELEDKDAR